MCVWKAPYTIPAERADNIYRYRADKKYYGIITMIE